MEKYFDTYIMQKSYLDIFKINGLVTWSLQTDFFLSWYSKNVYLCTCTANSILWVMIWLVNKETALYICLILSF